MERCIYPRLVIAGIQNSPLCRQDGGYFSHPGGTESSGPPGATIQGWVGLYRSGPSQRRR
jgi:hypothetical protein